MGALAALALAATLSAPPPSPGFQRRAFADYEGIVDHYRDGRYGEAVLLLDGWSRRDIQKVLDTLERRQWRAGRAAVMLHTDRALHEASIGSPEGEQLHVSVARRLAGIALSRGDTDFVGRWFRAAALAWQSTENLGITLQLLREGMKELPKDALLPLTLATVQEAMASLDSPGLSPAANSPRALQKLHGERRYRRTRLETALGHLDRALALDPTLLEARLRRGRILSRLEREDEARAELDKVLAGHAPPSLAYLAHLEIGRIHERAGRLEAAAAEYARATQAHGGNHTAHLALSHVRHRLGDPTGARAALSRAFGPNDRTGDADPWWMYPAGHRHEVDNLLRALREEAAS